MGTHLKWFDSGNYPVVFKTSRFWVFLFIGTLFSQCVLKKHPPKGDPDNGGLILPAGFEALVVADSVGGARHLAVNTNGDIYVKPRRTYPDGGNIALRDIDGDGKADIIQKFGNYTDKGSYGTAMRIHDGYLYFSSAFTVYRSKLQPGRLIPEGDPEIILNDDYLNDPHGFNHVTKPVTFDDQGYMYVPYGAPSDCCQVMDRIPESPGQQPCPQLEEHAGIWRFDPNKKNQTIRDGERYATGIRSAVAIDWNSDDRSIYIVQHGRDDLHRTWPGLYTPWQSALLPAEEFLKIKQGSDAGWPYYYYDQIKGKKLLNPEYGGDGTKEGKGSEYEQPLIGFPAHWAPNDLLFYHGDQFPEHYRNGAFITFHGSTIRGPYSQAGYFVGFVPFKNGKPTGEWEVFADGFAGIDTIVNTSDARYRPMGLAVGPDGSLYISDSEKGKIWRVMFSGNKRRFGERQLAEMEKRKELAHIRTPDETRDKLAQSLATGGAKLYNMYCVVCHQMNGKGDGNRFPPLDSSEWVNGDKTRLISVLLNGLNQSITVKGLSYNGQMPKHDFLKDDEIADILTYIRKNFGNDSGEILAHEVTQVRNILGKQKNSIVSK